MWLGLLVSFILTLHHQRSLAKNECRNGFEFSRRLNEVLLGHNIKKIEANHVSCTKTCAETLGCFSVNMYTDKTGREVCELNKSTKSASPASFVDRWGYEYDELTEVFGCSSANCVKREALPDGWYRFNSSLFKLFKNRLMWGGARQFCRSIGGDLVSITSEQENKFISEVLLLDAPRGNSTDRLQAAWKLDGTDPDITFHGNASVRTIDGHKALYLDGKAGNYATSPAVLIAHRTFMIGAWIKALTPASSGAIYSDWSAPYKFILKLTPEGNGSSKGNITFLLREETGQDLVNLQYSSINFNEWTHVTVWWRNSTLTTTLFINGKQVATQAALYNGSHSNIRFMNTRHSLYDIGLQRDVGTVFHGYIRDLFVYSRARLDAGVQNIIAKRDTFDGVWTGLSDLTKEGTFVNSDGSPVTFINWDIGEPNYGSRAQDCTRISLANSNRTWFDDSCGKELPFICEKIAT